MTRQRLAIALCLLLGAGLLPAPATADPSRAVVVEQLQRRAIEHFDAGRHEEALALYREAHDAWPLAALSFMEARCLEALGRFPEAVAVLERALTESPDDGLRGRAEQKLADLRERLKTGRLILFVEPAGAEISVDGEWKGTAPLPPLELPPGTYRVEARHPAYRDGESTIELPGGAEISASLALEAIPVEPELPPEEPKGPWYTNIGGWVTLGTGVAATAAGTALLVVGKGHHQEVKDLRSEDPVTSMGERRAYDLFEQADKEELAGYILLGIGGASLITSVVLFVTHDDGSGDGEEGITVSPTALPGGAGLHLMGRF